MQATKIQQEMEITLRVHFDDIDMTILDVFRKYPSRRYKVNQILSILSYQGIKINYGELSRRLGFLSSLTLIDKEKTSNVFSYQLSRN